MALSRYSKQEGYAEVEAIFVHDTGRALGVYKDEDAQKRGKREDVTWLPLSLIEYERNGRLVKIIAKETLLVDKRLV